MLARSLVSRTQNCIRCLPMSCRAWRSLSVSLFTFRSPFLARALFSTAKKRSNNAFQTISATTDYSLIQVDPQKYTTCELCSLLRERDISIPDVVFVRKHNHQIDNICLALSGRRDIVPDVGWSISFGTVASGDSNSESVSNQLLQAADPLCSNHSGSLCTCPCFFRLQPSIRLTAHTCEMTMESIIGSKQYDLLDLMWNLVDHNLRSHWSILGITASYFE